MPIRLRGEDFAERVARAVGRKVAVTAPRINR
jgi:hypothetical protein